MLKYFVMTGPSDYKKAYQAAQKELTELLSQREKLEKRIIAVRQTLQGLAALCKSENIKIDPSPEAEQLLANSKLTDEILSILRGDSPMFLRPAHIKSHLELVGHDMSKYRNPLATIHMVLKRQVEAGRVEEEVFEGKKAYRVIGVHAQAQNLGESLRNTFVGIFADIPTKKR